MPDTQLSLTEQAAFNFPSRAASAFGYGDTLLGLKYRFLHESEGVPQGAFYPQVNVPTGNAAKGLGAGVAQVLLPLWFQKSWGPWTTYGGGGYWINPGPGNKNWVFLGWEAQRDLSPAFTLGGELFYHSASEKVWNDSVGFNLGGIVNLDYINHIVFSAGKDFIQPTYQFTGYAAFLWTFPKEEESGKP